VPKRLSLLKLDEAYRHWLSYQPSCIDGGWSEKDDLGDDRCVACHIRRAGQAGVAYKPPFSAVPMTFTQHALQHQHGESYFHPAEWWEAQATGYLMQWLETVELDEEIVQKILHLRRNHA
jgi:hypothetical protein